MMRSGNSTKCRAENIACSAGRCLSLRDLRSCSCARTYEFLALIQAPRPADVARADDVGCQEDEQIILVWPSGSVAEKVASTGISERKARLARLLDPV